MNSIFYNTIDQFMEVHIDNVMVKTSIVSNHLSYLEMVFEQMRKHKLKINSFKCALGV